MIAKKSPSAHPVIIQGGMGMGVSNWTLAGVVSKLGHLGVISGTAIDSIFARRLQDGDAGGHMRRAASHFPIPDIAKRIVQKYFNEGGRRPGDPYKRIPMFSLVPAKEVFELSVLANFAEVFLAKEGHKGKVGINLLHKIQLPTVSSLYGAMLAGVDYVLMGAGIPRDIPAILDRLSEHKPVQMKVPVEGAAQGEEHHLHFDPVEVMGGTLAPINRPVFIAIIASATLAISLAKKCDGGVNGFIVEGPIAGGHNAPPRGTLQLNDRGEPVYGLRDEVDLPRIRDVGLPFWLAGGFADPERLKEARAIGAVGIQVGTPFAFCKESGVTNEIKNDVIRLVQNNEVDIFTDPRASPTGFPFKLIRLPGSMSEKEEYSSRLRVCDLGYLRTAFVREDGSIGYRCPSESPEAYVAKGGPIEDTVDRKCLCNGLLADIGLAQVQENGEVELPLMTSGEDLKRLARFIKPGATSYSAADVLDFILADSLVS